MQYDIRQSRTLTTSILLFVSAFFLFDGSALRSSIVLAQSRVQEDRYAFIIGIEKYNDRAIPSLNGASVDAAAMRDALVRYAGFSREHVELLTSDQIGENRPTKEQILQRLVALTRQVTEHSLLLFAFIGHGVELDAQGFLLPQDAVLTESTELLRETAIPVAALKKLLQQGSAKRALIVLDTCRERSAEVREATPSVLDEHCLTSRSSSELRFTELDTGVEVFSLLYATGLGMKSYTSPTSDRGYLTTAFIEGLKGQAANVEGAVTVDSLLRYLQKAVPESVRDELGKLQQPWVERGGVDPGDFVLVRFASNVPQRIVVTMPKVGAVSAAPKAASEPPPPPLLPPSREPGLVKMAPPPPPPSSEPGPVKMTPPWERFTLYSHIPRIFAVELETPGLIEPELRYEWRLDDKLVSTDEVFELKNQLPGVHTIRVMVRAPSGASLVQRWTVEVRKKEEHDPDVPSERWPAEIVAQMDDIVTDVTKKEAITFSGSVRNVGKREVDSFAVWVTAVDDNARPLSRRMLLVPQPQPLQPGQSARFSVVLANHSGNMRFLAEPVCR